MNGNNRLLDNYHRLMVARNRFLGRLAKADLLSAVQDCRISALKLQHKNQKTA